MKKIKDAWLGIGIALYNAPGKMYAFAQRKQAEISKEEQQKRKSASKRVYLVSVVLLVLAGVLYGVSFLL